MPSTSCVATINKYIYNTEIIEKYQEKMVMSLNKHINYQNAFEKKKKKTLYKWGPHCVTLPRMIKWTRKKIKSGNGQNCEENTDTETSCHNEKSRQTRRLANMFPQCRLTHSSSLPCPLPHSSFNHSLTQSLTETPVSSIPRPSFLTPSPPPPISYAPARKNCNGTNENERQCSAMVSNI